MLQPRTPAWDAAWDALNSAPTAVSISEMLTAIEHHAAYNPHVVPFRLATQAGYARLIAADGRLELAVEFVRGALSEATR